MKTTILLCAALLGAAFSTSAQVRIAPEVGVNFSNQTIRGEVLGNDFDESGDSRLGLKVGLCLESRLAPGLHFQPGFYLTQKGYNDISNVDNFTVNYLEVPLNLIGKIGTRRSGYFFIGGGPYLAAAIGGEGELEGGGDFDLEVGDDLDDDIARFDAGLNLTMGYEFSMGLFLRASTQLGVANVIPDDIADLPADLRARNRVFGISLGYFIN